MEAACTALPPPSPSAAAPLPVFQCRVQRATRLITTVPAGLLLARLPSLLAEGGAGGGGEPLPLPPGLAAHDQTVTLLPAAHRALVAWAGELAYSVHAYRLGRPAAPTDGSDAPGTPAAAVYMLDFVRGPAADVLTFRRVFDAVRARILAAVRRDATLAML